VIGMRMRDDRALDRLPGIDVEIPARAVQSVVRQFNDNSSIVAQSNAASIRVRRQFIPGSR
jgi:hypothetical protein